MGQRLGLIFGLLATTPAFAECPPHQVDLITRDGSTVSFTVEIADTNAERANGLMFRTAMGDWRGMLFVYPQEGPVAFWMKNTLIPLDMIFADASGVVKKIHTNAVPEDTTPIPGGPNIQYVLEINGGLSEKLGLEEGTKLRAAAIDQSQAAWACSE